jgi:hypothetical protein
MCNALLASEAKSENNKLITKYDEKTIKKMVIWVVEEGSVYILTANNKVELKNRISEFFTDPLAKEIYNSSLQYIGVATGFDTLKVKSLKLTQRNKSVEVFVVLDVGYEEGGSGQGQQSLT